MRRVVVFGASGGTGKEIVSQALERGHIVTAVFRQPSSSVTSHSRLTIVDGDPLNPFDVERIVPGNEVLISAIGPKRGPGARITASSEAVANIIATARKHKVKRLLAMSAWGTGPTRRGFYAWLLWRLIGGRMADKEVLERIVRESGLGFVIALPTLLTDGPRTGVYKIGHNLQLGFIPKISRSDVAHFVVDQIDDTAHIGKAVEISY